MDLDSQEEYRRNQKIFKQYSTTKVIEAAVSLRNVDKRLNSGKEIWERNIIWNVRSPGKLMRRMEEIFGLNIYKLMVLSSTEYIQEDIGDDELKKVLNICIRNGNCSELNGMVMEQGKNLPNSGCPYNKYEVLLDAYTYSTWLLKCGQTIRRPKKGAYLICRASLSFFLLFTSQIHF